MANMPNIRKTFIGAKLPTEIVAKARREAKNRGMSLSDFLLYILQKELDKCKTALTEDDVEWIRKELMKNVQKRNQ